MPASRRPVVLVPYLTHIEPGCDQGLRELEQRGIEVRRYPSTAAVDRTRCDAATAALEAGFDELIWIDSDIRFDPDDVERLRGHDLPIVAGVYAKKGVQDLAVHLQDGTTEVTMGEGGGLYDVRYVGAGFLCTQRMVYDDIQRTFSLPVCNTKFGARTVPYFLPMVIAEGGANPQGTGSPGGPPAYWYLGEDYAFCERARQAGHKIVVDTTIRLGHIGSYTYGWEDAGQVVPRVTSATFRFDQRALPKPA
jgi:hypothetical protein